MAKTNHTYSLEVEVQHMIEAIYLKRRGDRRKCTFGQIVSEGIKLLYDQEVTGERSN